MRLLTAILFLMLTGATTAMATEEAPYTVIKTGTGKLDNSQKPESHWRAGLGSLQPAVHTLVPASKRDTDSDSFRMNKRLS